LACGLVVQGIPLEPFGGPIAGYLGVRVLLERDGLQVVVPVSPGEGLVNFFAWEQAGLSVHYIKGNIRARDLL